MSSKRDIAREYKERPRSRGAFAVKCAPSGEIWVGTTPNLDTHQNALWFQMKLGGSFASRDLQEAWKSHGEEAFSYEVLEELSDDAASDYALRADLKALEQKWREQLSAGKVTG